MWDLSLPWLSAARGDIVLVDGAFDRVADVVGPVETGDAHLRNEHVVANA